nr:unnamed protein product [Digitaria exilis]
MVPTASPPPPICIAFYILQVRSVLQQPPLLLNDRIHFPWLCKRMFQLDMLAQLLVARGGAWLVTTTEWETTDATDGEEDRRRDAS